VIFVEVTMGLDVTALNSVSEVSDSAISRLSNKRAKHISTSAGTSCTVMVMISITGRGRRAHAGASGDAARAVSCLAILGSDTVVLAVVTEVFDSTAIGVSHWLISVDSDNEER